ncbi:MAG TPA: sigma 54-interacting transcriptional regulator [Kofleriaceae bacterium]
MTLPPSAGKHDAGDDDGARVPGVVIVFSGGAAAARAIPIGDGALEIGRGSLGLGNIEDGRVSRRHARITFDGWRCLVTDLGSQNGTLVDGVPAAGNSHVHRVIRVGDSLLIPCPDVRRFGDGVQVVDGFVRGPAMRDLLEQVARAARSGTTLHVRGENGTGKEGIAQAFHRASARAARALIAVNCAAIPHGIADRLLFGAKRGVYTGADADASGYIQEADGGTLFLDEIGELDLLVQSKLLRVLETRDLLPLGATKSRKVDFALCSATNKDLRALVAAGTLRQDLFYRIGLPAVLLPALRNRPEEIPALIAHELARLSSAPTAHVSLIEQCLLRPWPGNVRELQSEIRIAAQAALAEGDRVEARHLSPTAGTVFGSAMPEARAATADAHATPAATPPDAPRKRTRDDVESRQRIADALRANGGNVAATARALGMHRTQLRRLLERHGLGGDPPAGTGTDTGTGPGDDSDDSDDDSD